MKLHTEVIRQADSQPSKSMLFLHGIIGSGTNLRSLARRFCQARPQWQGVLVDLRAHGKSQGVEGDDTLQSAAEDVREVMRALDLPAAGLTGHSFGGKVVLSLLDEPGLEHAFTIDSGPGTRYDARGSESTVQILELLEGIAPYWETREKFVDHVVSLGQSKTIAQWLAMNLEREGTGLRLTLKMPRIRSLLQSYLATDLWPALEQPKPKVHLIIGERSGIYDEAERAKAKALEANGQVTVDLLPAGHWVHVDDFEGLLRVLTSRVEG